MASKTDRIQPVQVIKFFCIAVLLYGLIMVPWPGVTATYSNFFRAATSIVFETFGSEHFVRFPKSNNPVYDLKYVLYAPVGSNNTSQPFFSAALSVRYSGYIYAAFILSLILATPTPWKRKGWGLIWGMILLHGFLFFKMAIQILYSFSHAPKTPVIFNPLWKNIIFYTQQAFLKNMVFCFIITVFIWLFVSFHREMLQDFLSKGKM